MSDTQKNNNSEKVIGVKYDLTEELKRHIRGIRKDLNKTLEEMSDLLDLKLNTYKSIEKAAGTTSISSMLLNKIFDTYRINVGWENMPTDQFVIMHLEKYLYGPNLEIENLNKQDWVKAYYLKYQTITISEVLERRLLRNTDTTDLFSAWCSVLQKLNSNKHIKLKTVIKERNEVYIGLKQEKYPNVPIGPNIDNPYWCISYDLSDNDIRTIAEDIINNQKIRYSTLYSLLVILELEERPRNDYTDILSDIYYELDSYGYENIFDKIRKVQENYKDHTFQSNFMEQGNILSSGEFIRKLQDLKNGNMPHSVIQLIKNCTEGKDTFLSCIDTDFSPLFNASSYEIETFKTKLKDLINNYL